MKPGSRARAAPVLGACSLILATPAFADRATLVLEQSVAGQTNLFRTSEDEEGDGNYEVRPRLRLQRPVGDLQYLVEYSPTYNVYFETDGIDGFDQFGRGDVSYSPTPTDTVTLRSDFAYYRSIRSNTVEGPSGILEEVPDVSGRVFRSIADVGYEKSLSPATVFNGDVGLQAFEYTTPNNADSIGVGGKLSLLHELRRSVALGAMGLASYRHFDDLELDPDSHNTVLHFGPVARLNPLSTLTIDVQGGPAWLFADQDEVDESDEVFRFRSVATTAGTNAAIFNGCGTTAGGQPLLSQCPLAPAGALGNQITERIVVAYAPGTAPSSRDDTTLTGFARLLVRKEESWGYGALEYFRAEDASSGSGATSIRDSVTGTVAVELGTAWSLRFRGNWNRRETVERISETDVIASPSPVLSGSGFFYAQAAGLVVVDSARRVVNQYSAEARVSRKITRALSAELGVRYLYQDRDGPDSGSDEDDSFDNWRGVFGLRYELPSFDY